MRYNLLFRKSLTLAGMLSVASCGAPKFGVSELLDAQSAGVFYRQEFSFDRSQLVSIPADSERLQEAERPGVPVSGPALSIGSAQGILAMGAPQYKLFFQNVASVTANSSGGVHLASSGYSEARNGCAMKGDSISACSESNGALGEVNLYDSIDAVLPSSGKVSFVLKFNASAQDISVKKETILKNRDGAVVGTQPPRTMEVEAPYGIIQLACGYPGFSAGYVYEVGGPIKFTRNQNRSRVLIDNSKSHHYYTNSLTVATEPMDSAAVCPPISVEKTVLSEQDDKTIEWQELKADRIEIYGQVIGTEIDFHSLSFTTLKY